MSIPMFVPMVTGPDPLFASRIDNAVAVVMVDVEKEPDAVMDCACNPVTLVYVLVPMERMLTVSPVPDPPVVATPLDTVYPDPGRDRNRVATAPPPPMVVTVSCAVPLPPVTVMVLPTT